MKQKQSETQKIGLGPMQWATEIVDNNHVIESRSFIASFNASENLNLWML